ncbi:MAG: glycoside hydrolase [Actinobacteria bacterium 13_2_20CM_2_71_6]|nr:MAG: glycoside hydrolase [Actinobacteria bacterium 13_2_20CM_2_71_6]
MDQVGYLSGETKLAYLMVPNPAGGASFAVVNSAGTKVLTGTVGSSRGAWNTKYKAVYPINFSAVRAPGTYHITVGGAASGASPSFAIADAASLYSKAIADGVAFFQVQRDGPDVISGQTNRKPSHLNDKSVSVYAVPNFEPDSDVITDANLKKIGGPVNVLGGWFDAGDYLKFTHTTAYGDVILFAAERALGNAAPSTLDAEAHFGEKWLDRMWDQDSRTLYFQVGIGTGNSAGTFTGDHDIWRLPQGDDADTDPANRFATAHRPVFRAADPGKKISPNLVGRVSAAFALAAQVDAEEHPSRAADEYQAAVSLYRMADIASPPNPLVTALPNAFYPESTWHDDMELGAAELVLAAQALGHNASGYLDDAADFAKGYIATETADTLNLYDTSALAHADLIKALAAAGNPSVGISRAALVGDLKRQVQTGATRAASDVFHAGGVYTDFDVDSHTFGFLATQALYKQASGDTSFDAFATQQRNWVFGANAWGTSFMVGEGSTFPKCMQHQVDNLSPGRAIGAVVNGPNNVSQFEGGLGDYQTGMVKCPAGGSDTYNVFSTTDSRYVDDVRSWQASEPALDMSGSAILGLALQRSLGLAPTAYEAENATLAGGAKEAACVPCSGTKVGFVGKGGTVTFDAVTAPAPGTYLLTIYYTQGEPGRSAQISVNGADVLAIAFEPTGGFDVRGSVSVPVSLVAGTNTISIGNPAAYAPDFDKIVLSS